VEEEESTVTESLVKGGDEEGGEFCGGLVGGI
jgi:hypothetical protein